MRPRFNSILRTTLLGSRWGMAPFCLGLIVALGIVVVQFFRELAHAVAGFATMGDVDVILAVLKLVDLVLVANLVLMIISTGVEIFMPTLDAERGEGAGLIDFAGLKVKLLAAISAIAAIDLLESFINTGSADKSSVVWEIAMLLAFVVSGVLLALMDRLTADRH